jgi:hypothetical protein
VLLEKKKLSLEGSVKENLIQLVLTFDSSFFKGKKTLQDDPMYCFSCLLLDWVELVFCKVGSWCYNGLNAWIYVNYMFIEGINVWACH